MRLSRNRGNARGPTRLTNPLRRAMSCSARLSASPPNPPLRYSLLFSSSCPFPNPRRKHPSSSASCPSLCGTFRHSTHILPLCRPLAYLARLSFLPFVLHSPFASSRFVRSLDAFFSPYPLPPTAVFIFRCCLVSSLSSSVISPMSTSLRSSISSPRSHRRSARRHILPLLRLRVFFLLSFARESWPSSPLRIFLPSLLPNYRRST